MDNKVVPARRVDIGLYSNNTIILPRTLETPPMTPTSWLMGHRLGARYRQHLRTLPRPLPGPGPDPGWAALSVAAVDLDGADPIHQEIAAQINNDLQADRQLPAQTLQLVGNFPITMKSFFHKLTSVVKATSDSQS